MILVEKKLSNNETPCFTLSINFVKEFSKKNVHISSKNYVNGKFNALQQGFPRTIFNSSRFPVTIGVVKVSFFIQNNHYAINLI